MKRAGNLFNDICSIQNLILADKRASKGKSDQYGVKLHRKQKGCNILALHNMLMDKTFTTGVYRKFIIYEPKQREISSLPYFPDRIVHHAGMNKVEGLFVKTFTADTYACIKGRGIHAASRAVKKALRDVPGTQYVLKIDVTKFYPSIDHDILKMIIRKKIKDKDLLWLLDNIIDSSPGLPIGNYFSQYFANLYLAYFDHWIKEVYGVKYYIRYADDIRVFAPNIKYLHQLRKAMDAYLAINLKLNIKGNYQAHPMGPQGTNFLGYVYRHTHTLLRPSIKHNMARIAAKGGNPTSMAGYKGWAISCDSKHLMKTLNEKIQRVRDQANQSKVCGGESESTRAA